FAFITTALELAIGFITQRIFGHRLWDYRDNRFNFKGMICLQYSLIWAALAWVFFYLIFPVTYIMVSRLHPLLVKMMASGFVLYLILDTIYSTLQMADFFHRVEAMYAEIVSLRKVELQKIASKFSRFVHAFPYLNRILDRVGDHNFRFHVRSFLSSIARRRHLKRMKMKTEYLGLVKEIVGHSEYQKLDDFYHHYSSIYEHLLSVSFLSYRIAKALKLDYVSTVRGALLHDFFLYDWRNHDLPDLAANKYHGFAHPKIALRNAKRHFLLNKIEEDIIVKHMWPITIIPPRYMESYVVTFADKYLSSKEYTARWKYQLTKKNRRHPGRYISPNVHEELLRNRRREDMVPQ
ncbi:MAG TPA: hypothetical protein VF857_02795, partial [Spirochaetota bacterium]